MPNEPVIDTVLIDNTTYYLPASADDVIFLVNKAQQENKVVCLRGSAHSRPLISSLEQEGIDNGRLYIFMAKMKNVSFNKSLMQVTAEGGCHLGQDPSDPLANAPAELNPYKSTLENSLVYQLDNYRIDPNPLYGWALPDLGGIIHQTVGGFLSTGSSGSNLYASFNEQLVSISIVTGGTDGARLQVFSKDDPRYPDKNENPFYAAGVSMGLFGVIVSATFQCVTNFNIAGQESTMHEADCPIDLFGDKPDRQSLADFFKTQHYKRIMWWPQKGVAKTIVWQAKPIGNEPGFLPNPYKEIPDWDIFGKETPLPMEFLGDLMLKGFGEIEEMLNNLKTNHPLVYDVLDKLTNGDIVPYLLNLFVPLDPKVDGKPVPPAFQDVWYGSIPMDNKISDTLIPVWFTELWFPINKGPEVLSRLRKYFEENEDHVGNFSYEIYPAKASEFWLSPAYQRDVFRIDMFWFGDNPGSPLNTFYPALWNLLADLEFRPHWGKFLPPGDGAQGVSYLAQQYPNFEKWKAVRAEMDPKQVFVSNYWRGHLGIESL